MRRVPLYTKDDMKREQAANEEFRSNLTREQRHLQRRLDSVEGGGGGGKEGSGRRSGGRRSGGSKGGDDSGTVARPGVWSSSSCASLLVIVGVVVAFIMYAATGGNYAEARGPAGSGGQAAEAAKTSVGLCTLESS
jgi:hypothetical protein